MIILILIILLFFNIYLKKIKNSFYTAIVLFVLIINELYFSKIEKFQSNSINNDDTTDEPVGIPSFPDYRYGYDFKQHMNKQMCLFDEQENKIKTNASINTKCHKITNRISCDMYNECEYDTEFNRCNEKSNCNNIDTKPLECHYMDNEEICNTLYEKMPKCDIYDNRKECNKNEGLCKWDSKNKKCDYLEDTCIKLDINSCAEQEKNGKCKWNYYTDIYNAEPKSETNIIQCHSLKNLDMSKTELPDPYSFNNLEELNDTLRTIFEDDNYNNINYYGIFKTNSGNYNLYLLKVSNLDSISNSIVSKNECLNNNTYVGNNDHIMIYKRSGECKTIEKCQWETDESKYDMCVKTDNEQTCLEDSKCFYDYKDDKCKPKGFCKKKTHVKIVTDAAPAPAPAAPNTSTNNSNFKLAYNYMVDPSKVRRYGQTPSKHMPTEMLHRDGDGSVVGTHTSFTDMNRSLLPY